MIVAVAALLVATSGAALAAIPDADDVIHGCMNNRTGVLRVIDSEAPASQACTSKETPLDWNVTGPAGVDGDDGLTGPAGSVGATYRNRATGTGFAQVVCDNPAHIVTGGGGSVIGALSTVVPTIDGETGIPNGYLVTSQNAGLQVDAFVLCADNTP
jgi:hypothetical protein